MKDGRAGRHGRATEMGHTETPDLGSQSAKSKAVTAAGKDSGIGSRTVRDSYSLRLITDGNTAAAELDIEAAFRRQGSPHRNGSSGSRGVDRRSDKGRNRIARAASHIHLQKVGV